MPLIRTAPGALLVAALGGGLFKAVLSPYGIVFRTTARTADALVLGVLEGGVVFLLAFLAGHLGLRRAGVGLRWPYAGAGAVAALIVFAAATPRETFDLLVERGTASLYILLAVAVGAVIGFIYHRRADYETFGDEPSALAERLAGAPRPEIAEPSAPPAVSTDRVLVNTGGAEYFDGPLVVRTSVPVMFVAALGSMGLWGLGKLMLALAQAAANRGARAPDALWNEAIEILAWQGMGLWMFVVLGTLPFVVVIFAAHSAARALRRSDARTYALFGFVAPVLLGAVSLTFFFLGLLLALPGAVCLLVYKRLAGLEPAPVKEDVLVRDRRALVGADHPRRRFGRVVRAG